MLKPMLAVQVLDVESLAFPLFASPKLDGIRALCSHGRVLSRSLKDIPNKHVQAVLSTEALHGFDGELIVGKPFGPSVMQVTSSGVMSRDGKPDFTYHVFDNWTNQANPFEVRYGDMLRQRDRLLVDLGVRVQVLQQKVLHSIGELNLYEAKVLAQGYEGVMLRKIDGLYKYGRSTAREAYLMKLKRFEDSEARITGFDPKFHNANEQTRDERGYAKRSSHKENLVALDTLGALIVQDLKTGLSFKVGTGMDDQLRKHIWDNRTKYMKAIITYKSFPGGVKDLPRFPVFKAFRDPKDMSE